MKKTLIGIGVFAVIIGVYFAVTYNSLVAKRQAYKASWGQVQNVYQRRADLIPNLVEVVKGYAKHENSTLVAVTEARQQVMKIDAKSLATDAAAQKQFIEAQNQLTAALSKLLMVREAYPDLKANQNFLELQAQLEGSENRIAVARRDSQLNAQDYNTSVQGLFSHFVANAGGFKEVPYFEADAGAQTAPKVKF